MIKNKELLIATANRGKAREIQEIFADTDFTVKFLFDFSERLKDLQIKENAKSFEGNALIKAIIVGDLLGLVTLVDDSGLCVDVLDGQPGVFSARYSPEKTDQANNTKLLNELKEIPFEQRDCHYNCTVAIYDPQSKFVETVSGIWEGKIALTPRGNKSFGYAPIFLAKDFDYQKTNAELDPKDLIVINHRGQAFRRAIDVLKKYF
ncbi:MAG: RdgB/HAM1 family non-canonical purine NTP pyrophosphatase [Candidatus Buchananbacteria bacterium]